MADITYFIALPFDFVDGGIAAGEPIKCPNPAAAIQSAEGLWKIFGHAGAVAFSRTSDFEIGGPADRVFIQFYRPVSESPCLS